MGNAVGFALGFNAESVVGSVVGAFVGSSDGASEGFIVGESVGAAVYRIFDEYSSVTFPMIISSPIDEFIFDVATPNLKVPNTI